MRPTTRAIRLLRWAGGITIWSAVLIAGLDNHPALAALLTYSAGTVALLEANRLEPRARSRERGDV